MIGKPLVLKRFIVLENEDSRQVLYSALPFGRFPYRPLPALFLFGQMLQYAWCRLPSADDLDLTHKEIKKLLGPSSLDR